MIGRNVSYGALAALLLGGCASGPRLETGQRGPMPDAGTYRLADSGDGDAALLSALTATLAKRGLRADADGRYLVQLATSYLPGRMGLYAPEDVPADAASPSWLVSPTRSRKVETRRLVLTFTDAASGREVYRAFANVRHRDAPADVAGLLVRLFPQHQAQ